MRVFQATSPFSNAIIFIIHIFHTLHFMVYCAMKNRENMEIKKLGSLRN